MIRIEKKIYFFDKKIKVGCGFVELCDYMGDDETIVRTARQSYNKDDDELTDSMIDSQISTMLKNEHTSPFEQVVFQFHLRMPIFIARQWVRFRTARMNELSGRYSKFTIDDFYEPDENSLLNRSSYGEEENKTPNGESLLEREVLLKELIEENNIQSFEKYNKLLDNNIPKELARLSLPLTLMTEFYWQMDLHNLLHFIKLRMEEHSQKEIREYAIVLYQIVKKICPITSKYFMKYQFNSYNLSEDDISTLSCLISKLTNVTQYEASEEEKTLFGKIKSKKATIEKRNSVFNNDI
jgi:thymidylate synthase (FAD)